MSEWVTYAAIGIGIAAGLIAFGIGLAVGRVIWQRDIQTPRKDDEE